MVDNPVLISLISYGEMVNITVDNQGDHCIIARSGDSEKLVDENNHALFVKPAACKETEIETAIMEWLVA